MGSGAAGWLNTRRYLPPTRTSISQESRDRPVDFGTHHRLNSSGLVHASNTRRAGPLMVRVTTSSRSDFRSTVVRFFPGVASLSLLASIDLLLACQLLDNLVQRIEACVPELAVPFDPRRFFLQSAQAELAGPHTPDLLRGDEPRLLQDADVLLHAREGHVELLGKVRDRSVCTPELLQNAASRGVRERGERGIETGFQILNHVVQYITHGLAARKGTPSARAEALCGWSGQLHVGCVPLEFGAVAPDGVQDDGKLARYSNGGPLPAGKDPGSFAPSRQSRAPRGRRVVPKARL